MVMILQKQIYTSIRNKPQSDDFPLGGGLLALLRDGNQSPKCFYPKFFRISTDIDLEIEPETKNQE